MLQLLLYYKHNHEHEKIKTCLKSIIQIDCTNKNIYETIV